MRNILNRFKKLSLQDGQAAIIVALAMFALTGMMAFVIDTGSIYEERRNYQAAADSAALAGAQELPENPDLAVSVAQEYAAMHGVNLSSGDVVISTTSVNNDTITINASNPEKKLFFGGIFGSSNTSVGASATARVGSMAEYTGVTPWGLIEGLYEYGEEYTLKYGAPPDPSPGNFGALAIDGTGAPPYETGIIMGCETPIKIGDWVDTQTGNMAGPTSDGVNGRIAREPGTGWNYDLVAGDFDLAREDSQFIIVPIISAWPNGSSTDTQIVGFKPFVISGYSGIGGQALVTGVFLSKVITITNGAVGDYDQSGIKVIRLLK